MARPGRWRRPDDLPAIVAVVGIGIALIENLSPPIRLASLIGGIVIAALLRRGETPSPPVLVEGPVAKGRLRVGLPTETKILLGVGVLTFQYTFGSDNQALLVAAIALVGAIVINALVAVVTSRRRTVEVRVPTLTTVGEQFRVDVRVDGLSLSAVRTALPGLSSPTSTHDSNNWVPVSALAPPRGIHESVRVIVRDSGPLGLINATRQHTIRLDTPLHVVPPVPDLNLEAFLATTQSILNDDDVIGLREAEPGASVREVHWPSVLRTGRLIVRQRSTVNQTVDVIVELAGVDEGTLDRATLDDTIVGLALAVGESLLRAGRQVRLHYCGAEAFPAPFVLNPDIGIDPYGALSLPTAARVVLINDVSTLGRTLAGAGRGSIPRPQSDQLITVNSTGVTW